MNRSAPDLDSLPLEVARRLNAVCDAFEAAWQDRAGRPRIEEFVSVRLPGDSYPVFAQQLILLEIFYRRRDGEVPDPKEYAARFPDLERSWVEQIVCDDSPRGFSPTNASEQLPTIPGYAILGVLGRGGMGVVYQARHLTLKRLVAIKMILAGEHAGQGQRARFKAEAEAIARLQHPNIVQVHEVGEHNGKPFIALEYCAGGSLDAQLNGTPLPPVDAARLAETLARALEAAHRARVIHRDLKPANVLLQIAGEPCSAKPAVVDPRSAILKVTDFGLAKQLDDMAQTLSGAIMGTPSYMAPEQAGNGNKDPGPAIDIYALGAMLYELLTGRPPFKAASSFDTIVQVVNDEPVPPTQLQSRTPRDLETICLKCLQKEPAKRYASAAELADELGRYLRGEPILARPVGRLERAIKWMQRNKGLSAGIAAAVLALLLGTAVSTWLAVVARLALDNADTARQAEKEAKIEALHKLWGAYQSQASARRLSGRRGQRFETLEAIGAALKLPLPPGRSLDELRNEAIAALCLPDVGPGLEWDRTVGPTPPDDPTFRRYFECCRLWAGVPEPKVMPKGQMLSPDFRFVLAGLEPYLFTKKMTVRMRLYRQDGLEFRCVLKDDPAVCEEASAFSPDSRQLALGHLDGTVSLYDTESGAEVGKLKIGAPPFCLAYHPKLPRLAVGAWMGNRAEILIFDFEGKALRRLGPHPELIFSIAWRPDGQQLAAGCNNACIYLWDAESGLQVTPPWKGHSRGGIRVSFNRAGDRVVSNDWGGHLRLWDARSGRELFYTPEIPYFYPDPCYYPDAPPSMVGPTGSGNKDRLLRVAEGHELRQLYHSSAAARETLAIAPHPDGRLHAFLCSSGLGFLDITSGNEVAIVPLKIPQTSCEFDGSGTALLTHDMRAIYRWPVRLILGSEPAYEIGPPERVADFLEGVNFSCDKDSQVFAIPKYSKGALVVLRNEGNREIPLQPQHDVRWVAVSADGRWVATQSHGDDNSGVAIKIWEASSGRLVAKLPIAKARFLRSFTPDGRWLVTASEWAPRPPAERAENFLRLWKVGTWQEGGSIPTLGNYFWDQDVVIEGHADGTIGLTQISTRKELARLTSPEPGRVSVHDISAGFLLAQGETTGTRYSWDLPLIRRQLAEMGLDWDGPPYFPASNRARSAYAVRVNAGQLAK